MQCQTHFSQTSSVLVPVVYIYQVHNTAKNKYAQNVTTSHIYFNYAVQKHESNNRRLMKI